MQCLGPQPDGELRVWSQAPKEAIPAGQYAMRPISTLYVLGRKDSSEIATGGGGDSSAARAPLPGTDSGGKAGDGGDSSAAPAPFPNTGSSGKDGDGGDSSAVAAPTPGTGSSGEAGGAADGSGTGSGSSGAADAAITCSAPTGMWWDVGDCCLVLINRQLQVEGPEPQHGIIRMTKDVSRLACLVAIRESWE
jgi:hypothetical protein